MHGTEGRACNMHGTEGRACYMHGTEGRAHLEDVGLDGRIILKWF